jgi:acetylornithine/succinyldiaminopimelate/putrescine aminotransferase
MDHQRYLPATAETIDTIAALNRAHRPNMSFSGLTVTEECAQVGYLLDGMHPDSGDHVTYFVNSFEEAISGVARLVRHSSKVGKCTNPQSWILIIDTDGRLAEYFDPLGEGPTRGLARHMVFASSVEQAMAALNDKSWSAVFVVADSVERCDEVFAAASARGAMRVFCDARDLPERGRWRAPEADVYVYGENLAGRQLPFGCYVMTRGAYAVWNNPIDAMAQISTFAASATALHLVLNTLRQQGFVSTADDEVLAGIDQDKQLRNECYRRFVNPSSGQFQEGFRIDYEVDTATGMTVRLRDGTTYIDCAFGTGTNLRGHNPVQLSETLSQHDPEVDYIELLTGFFVERTPYDTVLPAVSGATSVENALLLARLARPDRPKIVTFLGNFSGKTIASLNVSRYGPQRSSSVVGAYEPYYPDVTFVDPFSSDAVERLNEALDDPQVGLFWAELIQGFTCTPVPADLFEVICDQRRRHGFLVGVDEVLTGVWRSSDRLLYHSDLLDHVDLTTLAKPLSDMTIPVAATLARKEVVEAASANYPDAVHRLHEQYRNNLSAHVAWRALTSVDSPESQRIRRKELAILRSGLERAVDRSAAFDSVRGLGAHIRITLNRRYFPFRDGSPMGELIDQMVGDVIMRRTGVVLARGRFFPPIFPAAGSMAEVASRLEGGLPRVTVYQIYRTLLVKMFELTTYLVHRRFATSSPRVRQLHERGRESSCNRG